MEKWAERARTSDAVDVADTPTMFGRNVALHAASERLPSYDATHGRTKKSTEQE